MKKTKKKIIKQHEERLKKHHRQLLKIVKSLNKQPEIDWKETAVFYQNKYNYLRNDRVLLFEIFAILSAVITSASIIIAISQ